MLMMTTIMKDSEVVGRLMMPPPSDLVRHTIHRCQGP
jgi:hypothetical protein